MAQLIRYLAERLDELAGSDELERASVGVLCPFGAAVVLLKPAPKGSGVKAGGAVRIVLELAGVPNVVSKILGSSNKTNNVKATFAALRLLRLPAKTEKSEESAVAKK